MILLALLLLSGRGADQNFSEDRAMRDLRHLCVEIGPRPMGSPAEQEALRFAAEEFRKSGCDTAYIMPMVMTASANTTSGVAVGIKRGRTGRMIVFGGHIDSEGPEVPGADDDGSGAVTVLELARVFGKKRSESTLVFCCFGGEEQGLKGSRHFVASFPDIDSVGFMIQLDMANGLRVLDMDPDARVWSAPAWLVRGAVEEYRKLGYDNLRYPTHFFSLNYSSSLGASSDHESFLDAGIPAIDFSSDVGKPIHTPRDNIQNFEPGGIRRSGLLAERIVERFDGKIPGRDLERYWLYIIGGVPLTIPIWGLKVFLVIAVAMAAVACIAVGLRRAQPSPPPGVRGWSFVKMLAFAVMIVSCGWFSADLVGLIRGLRHPWYTSIDLFILQAVLGALIGAWLIVRSEGLKLSLSPFRHALFCLIPLMVMTLCAALINIKVAVDPAASLILLSASLIVRSSVVRGAFLILSPLPVFRLVISEWRDFLFRAFGNINTEGIIRWSAYNGSMIVFFTLLLLPFCFGAVAVVLDSGREQTVVSSLRSRVLVGAFLLAFVTLTAYLSTVPVYTSLWYRDVRINERYDMDSGKGELAFRSAEFLSGKVRHNTDTTLPGRSIMATIPPGKFDPSWVHVARRESVTSSRGDDIDYEVSLRVDAFRRPLSVTYAIEGKTLKNFDSEWRFTTSGTGSSLRWFSYPDSELVIPVKFSLPRGDSARENLDIVFDTLNYPVRYEGELTYTIPRTTFSTSHVYRR